MQNQPSQTQSDDLQGHTLPTEVWLLVTSSLPRASIAALAICSRSTFKSLGHYFQEINQPDHKWDALDLGDSPILTEKKQERTALLRLLEQRKPDLILCGYCQKLHRPDRPISSKVEKGHCHVRYADYLTSSLGKNITVAKVSWCMRKYTGSDQIIELRKLFLPEIIAGTYNTVLLVPEPRIIQGCFYLRTQIWIGVETQQDGSRELPFVESNPRLCRHTSILGYGAYACRLIKGRLSIVTNEHNFCQFNCADLLGGLHNHTCETCLTRWQSDLYEVGPAQFAIAITAWQAYGDMHSSFDKDWWGHFSTRIPWYRRYELEKLKEVFEGDVKYEPKLGCGDLRAGLKVCPGWSKL